MKIFTPYIDHFMHNETERPYLEVRAHGGTPRGFRAEYAINESTEKLKKY